MKSIVRWAIWLSLLILLVSCTNNTGSWERIAAEGVLRVGLDPTYPPFEVADGGGNVSGLDVDLAETIAADLGLKVQFSHFGYDGLYDALATNQVDLLLSAMVIVPGRTKDFAYSKPYFNAGEILIVAVDEDEIEEMADLNGRSLAVELGAQGHVEATQWAKRLPDLTILPHASADEALTAVANHEADAALVDSISGRLYLAQHPELKRITPSITVEPFALVVRIEDELLLKKLDERLTAVTESGQLDEITRQWIGP